MGKGKKLASPPRGQTAAGEKETWEDVTGEEAFVKDGVPALSDGQAVTVDPGK